MQLTTSELVVRARSLIRPGRRTILGIAGPPGAGKSTLAHELERALGETTRVVGMDGFHLAHEELVRLGRLDTKGAPDTFDSYGYAALLKRLREAIEPVVYAPAFSRELEASVAGSIPIGLATPLIITEGNYLLLEDDGWILARQQLDEVWYLDIPDEVRQRRLARRHAAFGKDPDDARRWATGSDQDNALIVRARMNSADLVVTVLDE